MLSLMTLYIRKKSLVDGSGTGGQVQVPLRLTPAQFLNVYASLSMTIYAIADGFQWFAFTRTK
jgi:hypothetical protein